MLKFIAPISIFLLLSQTSNAQLHKGNVFISGNFTNLEFNSSNVDEMIKLDFKPKIGYFWADNLVVGLYSNLSLNKTNNFRIATGGLGAFGRYYFNNINTPTISHLRFFGELSLGYLDSYNKYGVFKQHYPSGQLGIAAGAAYFISSNVSIETALGYQLSQSFNGNYTNHRLNFEIGVQVYLPSSRVKDSYKQFKQEVKP